MRANIDCVKFTAMRNVPSLFDAVGGPGKVAELLGVKPSAASEMKRRKSIPVRYWPRLVDGCRDAGIADVNYGSLVAMHSEVTA